MNKILFRFLMTLLLMPTLVFANARALNSASFGEFAELVEEEVPFAAVDGPVVSVDPEVDSVQVITAEQAATEEISITGHVVLPSAAKSGGPAESCDPSQMVTPAAEAMPFSLETTCFSNRPRAAEYSFEMETFANPAEYIKSDAKTCECMKKSATGELEKSAEVKPNPDATYLQNLLANVKLKQQRVQNFSEGIVVQSMLLSGDKDKSMSLMSIVANKQDLTTIGAIDRLRNKFRIDALKKLTDKSDENTKKVEEIANLIYPPKEVEKIELPSPNPAPKSCISMQSYLAYAQTPKEPEFFQDVAGMADYESSDWNLNNLKDEYNKVYLEAEQASPMNKLVAISKVKSIKARINFLNKNPLVANFFSIDPAKWKGNKTFDDNKVKMFQKALFRTISRNLKPTTTVGGINKFKTELAQFFNNKSIGILLRTQLDDQILEEYGAKDDLFSQKIPTSQPALENRYSLISGSSVKSCTGDYSSMSLEQCTANFHGYCKLLEKSDKAMSEHRFGLNRPSDNMDEQSQFGFNTDPNKNEGFKRISDLLCNKKRIPKNDKKGKPVNFAEYKAEFCANPEGKPECQSGTNDKLLLRFIGDYDFADPKYNGDKSVVQMTSVFTAVAASQPKVELTQADISKVGSNAVSYSELTKTGYSKNTLYTTTSSRGSTELLQSLMKDSGKPTEPVVAPLAPTKSEEAAQSLLPTTAMAPLSSAASIPYASATTPDRSPLDEVAEVRSELKEKIAKTKEDISSSKKSGDKSALAEMEERLKSLEGQLAKKDAEYKKLFEEKDKVSGKSGSGKKSGASGDSDEVASSSRPGAGSHSSDESGSTTGGVGRSIAGKVDPILPSGAISGGPNAKAFSAGSGAVAAAGIGQVSGSANYLNSALLEKYGIVVAGSTEGNMLVAPEKDPKNLKQLAAAQVGDSVDVKVTSVEYDSVKNNELFSFQDIYDKKKLKDISGKVLKVSVTSDKKDSSPVEFYAIREGEKVVFQLVRFHELDILRKQFQK